MEKAASGFFRGVNSSRDPWILDDAMYAWGVNTVNRGGIVQTRPGYNLALTLPPGLLQGGEVFQANKDDATAGFYQVFAVDGKVYAQQFNDDGTLPQPEDWELRRLKNIQFSATAPIVIFCIAQQSITQTATGDLSLVSTHNILMMQDGGVTAAAYFDGTLNDMLDETAPALETPAGSWMAFSGGRLWVGRDNALIASDLYNPLLFTERINGTARGDFLMPDPITGMITTIDQNRQTNLVVFTEKSSFNFLTYIADRTQWATTFGFQTTLYPTLGCVSGLSPVNHAGLLWWYSHGGLVASDSATTAYLSSRIKYKDVEMARSKRNLSPDLSGICTCSFEEYLLVSVPSGDTLNSQTWVMDYAVSDELLQQESPAWQGVWTGTRPVKWASADIYGVRRCFQFSVDYQALGGSANHLWEAFQNNREDTTTSTDVNGLVQVVENPIYWSFESKLHGDGLDLKKFVYAVVNLIEVGGVVNIKVSYRGTRGGFKKILQKKILAYIDNNGINSSILQNLLNSGVVIVPQARKLFTEEAKVVGNIALEGEGDERQDKCFSLYIQGCGRAGIQSYQIFMDPVPEKEGGRVTTDETDAYVVTQDGTIIKI